LPEHNVKQEVQYLLAGYVALSIVFFVAFRQSPLMDVLRTTASIYWMFVLPGYALALCSRQGFVDRVLIGTSVQVGVFGLASYYLSLMGWSLATHGLVLPVFSIIVGIVLWKRAQKPQV